MTSYLQVKTFNGSVSFSQSAIKGCNVERTLNAGRSLDPSLGVV
jgi:hypothetical protein